MKSSTASLIISCLFFVSHSLSPDLKFAAGALFFYGVSLICRAIERGEQ